MEEYLGTLFRQSKKTSSFPVNQKSIDNPIVPISKQIIPFIRISQLGGAIFLSIEPLNPPSSVLPSAVQYVVKPKSWGFIFSLVVFLTSLYLYGTFTLIFATGIQGPIKL